MASAIDDVGFEVRDCLIWLYTQNQMKAMGLDYSIHKSKYNEQEKREFKQKFIGWKTPQLKSCFEPIVMAQKPTEGTYLQNVIKNGVGLINTNLRVGDDMLPANVMSTEQLDEIVDKVFLVPKPLKSEKGEYNIHQTVKPLALCEHLIKLFAFNPQAVILDPFLGSGTTAVAAKRLNRHYIGMEINEEYIKVAHQRLREVETKIFKLQPVIEIPKQQAFVLAV